MYQLVRSQKSYDSKSFAEDMVNVPWHVLSHFDSVDDKLASFSSLFSDVLDHHVPVKVIKTKVKPRPFITAEIKTLMHQRDLAHRIARKTHNPRDWLIFRNIKRQVKFDLQLAESDFIKNEIQTNRNDSNSLWKTIRRCLPVRDSMKPTYSKEPSVVAQEFNEFLHLLA